MPHFRSCIGLRFALKAISWITPLPKRVFILVLYDRYHFFLCFQVYHLNQNDLSMLLKTLCTCSIHWFPYPFKILWTIFTHSTLLQVVSVDSIHLPELSVHLNLPLTLKQMNQHLNHCIVAIFHTLFSKYD
jgi:hypothetical protein